MYKYLIVPAFLLACGGATDTPTNLTCPVVLSPDADTYGVTLGAAQFLNQELPECGFDVNRNGPGIPVYLAHGCATSSEGIALASGPTDGGLAEALIKQIAYSLGETENAPNCDD